MKFLKNIQRPPGRSAFSSPKAQQKSAAGFTLVEMMISLMIFTFLIAATVGIQVMGLRVNTLAATKLTATTSCRETLNSMRDKIRSAQRVYVGIYTNGTFTQTASGVPQIGNALQLFATTNTASTNFTCIFYQDPSTNEVFSVDPSGNRDVLATYMTNYYCFQAEDYETNVLTNYKNNPVIRVTMNFSQWEYPIGYVGGAGANAYDYYYLRTRVTPRCKQ